jgi:outer membrane protein OmpA-like peptidoglycan-associated protein
MGVTSSRSVRTGTSTLFAWLFILGLLVSVAVHLALYLKAKGMSLPAFSAENYDTVVPRTFRMKRVEIDASTQEEPQPQQTPKPKTREVSLPVETPDGEKEMKVSRTGVGGSSDELPKPVVNPPEELKETPESRTRNGVDLLPDPMNKSPREQAQASGEIGDARDSVPKDLPAAVVLNEPASGGNGAEGKTGSSPAFSSLDDLLEGKKPLTPATPPILMPTDLLFGYDSDALRPEAASSLSKLGTLISNSSVSKFRIEGHTDSFGTDPYNDALSIRRAEAVKSWLVSTMGISPERITTAGLGRRHLLTPATGSISEQQLNRRVEIVITKD